VWKGGGGTSTVAGDEVLDERSEKATLSPVSTKPASSVRKGNPRLVLPLKAPRSTAAMKSGYRVSEYFPPGRARNPRLIVPPKAPLKPKGNIPSLVRTKSGSSDNPIDVDATHPTWDPPVKNLHMVKGTRPATDSRPGVQRVFKATLKAQKPVRPSPSLHRSVLTKPATGPTYQHSDSAFPAAVGSYQAAGQNVQKLQSLPDTQTSGRIAYPSLSTAPYQQYAVPFDSSHYLHRSQLPAQFPFDARYSHYPVDPRQYPPMSYPILQLAKAHPKHMPQSTLVPTDYAKSKYHQPLASLIHYLPGHEEHLRQRAVQYVREYSRRCPRKRSIFEDPEATSGSEYESGTSFPHIVNKFTDQGLRAGYDPQALAPETHSSAVSVATRIEEHDLDLEVLVSHTQLLTDMLHAYPRSRDKIGLREDMETLISIQNQRFHDWVAGEKVERTRKKAKLFNANIDSDRMVYAFMRGGYGGDETESEQDDEVVGEKEKEKAATDKKVLGAIASTADMWEKKKGMGIVDVFANGEGGSSLAMSEDDDVDSVLGSDG
jgi:hypothetical protein